MNNELINNIINNDINLKLELSKKYFIETFNKDNIDNEKTYLIMDNYFLLLNGKKYDLNIAKNTFSEICEKIENNKKILLDNMKEINNTINENLKYYQSILDNIRDKNKNNSFLIKNLQINLVFDRNYNFILNMNDSLSLIKCVSIETIYNKSLDYYAIEEFVEINIEKILKNLVSIKIKDLIQHNYRRIEFENSVCNDVFIEDNTFGKIQVIKKALYDRTVYNNVLYECYNFNKNKSNKEYLNEFLEQFSFEKSEVCKKYDIINGYKNPNFDLYANNNDLNELVEEIKSAKTKLNELKKCKELDKMYNFVFMNCIKIDKILEKKINNNSYVVYNFKYKDRKDNYWIFINGKKVNRKKFHEAKKILKLNKVVKMNNITDWNKISRCSLSQEQIEKYYDKLNWKEISIHRPLPKDMLTKYVDKIYWPEILMKRNISEKLIEQLSSKIGWDIISEFYYKMSYKFFERNMENINMSCFLKNPKSKEMKEVMDILVGKGEK